LSSSPRQPVDLGVSTPAADVDVLVRVAHDDAHDTAHTQVDFGLGRLPVVLSLPPASDHLLAGPRVEHRLGGRLKGALDAQRVGLDHVPGSRRRPTRSMTQARTTSKPVLVPASAGSASSSGTPPT
jgi:hypothetical protein